MKKVFALLAAVTSLSGFAGELTAHRENVIYGIDGRKDLYQISSSSIQKLANATAAQISNQKLLALSGIISIPEYNTLEESGGVCPTEKFSQQPTIARCSGFLVAPDLMVTAGHCMETAMDCSNNSWVFDYKMTNATSINLSNISVKNIYKCKQIVTQHKDNIIDYAVIKLDRAVVGRTPLKVRKTGSVKVGDKLLVIGAPSGLPTKVTDGAVLKADHVNYFATNLDTFHGNSGSAVINSVTGEVEGILVRGRTDYVPSIKGNPFSCMVVNKCDDRGKTCVSGVESIDSEHVTRISMILPALGLRRK